jgi:hypothetical protein
MSNPLPDPWPESDSRDCVNIVIDCPGDNTVRPLSPEILKVLRAEREMIARWEEELKKQQASDQSTDGSNPPANDVPN